MTAPKATPRKTGLPSAAEFSTELSGAGLSGAELAALGTQTIAFIKPVEQEGRTVWSIHAADGQPLGAAQTRDAAMGAALQHNLTPISVH
ncbi:DUF1150 family protein [Roseospirillum parvum]|uniref:DUF1150 family protein n=1 Tax=Roseospirillum parvum TaxID=83401 RepID=A0A1G7UFX0_9PROT|nr:DUF1150 family protein [Roseospirillum parvum]SDG46171.1 hypothetical protein SAMN05421742_101312 [Roseospirillum parvum]